MAKHFYLSEDEKKSFYENGFAGPFTLFEPEEMTRIWNEVRLDLLDTSNAPFPDSRLNYDPASRHSQSQPDHQQPAARRQDLLDPRPGRAELAHRMVPEVPG